MPRDRSAGSDALSAEAEKLRDWLFEAAFPLWWRVGADRSAGGYYEQIAFDGRPIILPKRSRVAARQVFCYHQAGRLGWHGPWWEAGRHALSCLRERFVRSDGTVVAAVAQDGVIVDAKFDLYNQAFALLAYACAHQTIEPGGGWRIRAYALMETLNQEFAHPRGGFREDHDGKLTLRANPHMHLLEAALVWASLDHDPVWRRMADGIATLCLEHFIDRETGALREYFGTDWAPLSMVQGQIVEPGHHYEWAFLLDQWAKLTGRDRPTAVATLIKFADLKGIDRHRRVAVNAISLDGRVHNPVARLWPQTERIRAYIIDCKDEGDARLHDAIATLWRYLGAPISGLWYENLDADGRFMIEAAPATSLYHIVGAAAALWATFPARESLA
jgi:mannose-6-phosphate isomerase